jgi:drug/metabolite transporter (DMT)-like permease
MSARPMPYLVIGGAQVAIGAAPIFARYALGGAGPLAVSALRLALAALVVVVIARRFEPLSVRRELAFAIAGFALAAHFATWIASLSYASVAISTLLVTTTPLWTETYDVIRERRLPSRSFVTALILGIAGVALVVQQRGAGHPPIPGHELLGEALALAGSIAIGVYLLVVRDAAQDPSGIRLATRQIVARTYGWAALSLVVAAAFAHEAPPPPSSFSAWGGILAMALISQLLGHTALNASLATFSPSVVALSTLCEPVVATVLAGFIFHEALGPATAGGGALVLVAVALTLRAARPAAEQPASL